MTCDLVFLMTDSLFEENSEAPASAESAPLAVRMAPLELDEFAGQEHIVGPGRLLRRAIQKDQLSSIILSGPPGTGKTTLARVIANTTASRFVTLNPGDVLFTGTPGNTKKMKPGDVVEIDVDDSEIVQRLSGRRVHLNSGRTYHITFNPPTHEGRDDISGEQLIQRDDDKEETVKKRLEIYHSQTKPLVDYYSDWAASGVAGAPKYVKIAGVGTVEQIRDHVFAALQ